MAIEIEGRIVAIAQPQSGVSKASGKNWFKQECIIETLDAQYPNKVCFEVFGEEKVNELSQNHKVNDVVKVSVNISAKEYNGRWYNTIKAWKIEKGGENVMQQNVSAYEQAATAYTGVSPQQNPSQGMAQQTQSPNHQPNMGGNFAPPSGYQQVIPQTDQHKLPF